MANDLMIFIIAGLALLLAYAFDPDRPRSRARGREPDSE